MATCVARGIEKLGLPAEQDYKGTKLRLVGLYSRNREEWVITDIACWMMNIANVPLYDTLGEESICWTFEQTLLSTIFLSVDGIEKLAIIKKEGKLETLKQVVCYDEVTENAKAKAGEVGIEIIKFAEVLQKGEEDPSMPLNPCGPDDLITICYTSGTTDKAKGTVLTHRNFRENTAGSLFSGVLSGYKVGFTFISYLPLAHVFERIIFYVCILGGFKVAFFHGVITELNQDIVAAKPDILIGVPRVFGRFYDVIMSQLKGLTGFKRKLIDSAISTKLENYHKDGTVTHWFYDKIVLGKIRNAFGGRAKTFVSAAAPIDVHLMEMLKILCSCNFLQGYGQTETAGPISISYFDDTYPGSSGPPVQCSVVKVVDVPEMNYFATDTTDGKPTPRGELCIKGSHIMKEYFKDPIKTESMFDGEGWFHTGDIALLTPVGGICIIDRKKNIFKLQHGEYVAPEKIENTLATSPWILQLFIYGDSYQTYLVGILIPNKETVMNWAKEHNITATYEELCKNQELADTIVKDLEKLGREKKVFFKYNIIVSWI